MSAYLEPNFEVKGGAGVTGGMEEAEGDTAIDAAAKQDGNFKALMGHRAGQVRPKISIDAVWRMWSLGNGGGGRAAAREGSEEEGSCGVWRVREK